MKVFQIIGGLCHWDASDVLRRAEDAAGRFPEDDIFVDAPDYVYEGWGFDGALAGDERFIKPVPPEGWLYDDWTGTFYRDGEAPPSELPRSAAELAAENAELRKTVAALEEQLTQTQLALCDVYENTLALIGG